MCEKTTQSITLIESNGFSLIDLLFALILFSILLGLAFPSYRHFMIEVRLLSLTERIKSAINYARSEAIRQNSVVTLCKSKDGMTCIGQWQDGWIIFLNKYAMNFSKNTLLRVHSGLAKVDFLEWHGAGGREYLQLNPDGSAYGYNGSFVVCVKLFSEEIMWLIRVSPTGRVRVDKKREYRWNCNNQQ